jgi:uncharacterized membrane protein YhaH (DUF805 family)
VLNAFAWLFLSLRGRISRQEYWLGYLGLIVLYIALIKLSAPLFLEWQRPLGRTWWYRNELDAAMALPKLWLAAAFTWPMATLYVKRLHDMNLSAWWLFALPLLSLLASTLNASPLQYTMWACVVGLGVLPGTRGDNRFGADPLPMRA